ncbi:hypothetical protein C7441_12153 [Pseudaminobacter salicylatoxidans]|uniref:Uncharacterized protein n=1 Tax=Pseudaminobacter salicylatoxidans TaxID=93369 RepID=A0A316BPX3_PSESE|nr:hypothetical protein [Pseudaminobacter salicylatoxidans]PWJ75271.1 hypothetical protein C7441_12153 [Pseudaminobacter salicylatoxidans]
MTRKTKAAQKKPAVPKVPKEEKEQVRARKAAGLDYALTVDGHGRERLINGTAEAERKLEKSQSGVVRVRTVDPLVGISSLTWQQREAGKRYRDEFEAFSSVGAKGIAYQVRVDGGALGGGIPAKAIDTGRAFKKATDAIGHWDVSSVVQAVCCSGSSISEVAKQVDESRDVVVKLLKIGLDNLAVEYGILVPRRPRVA